MSAPYRPGRPPWPENQQHRPDRPPPIQFHEEQAAGGTSALDWTLRILGLVAVAVISGFLWWFLNNEEPTGSSTGYGPNTSTQPTTTDGEFEFVMETDGPIVDESCSQHSYGQIQKFLTDTPCEQLIRAVYSTEIEGRKVFTSVSVVEMAEETEAKELRDLTDTDNTGNVSDLVREGEVRVDGLKTLSGGGGYDSAQHGTDVIIVESDYDPSADEDGSEDELDRVCSDALRLSSEMVDRAG